MYIARAVIKLLSLSSKWTIFSFYEHVKLRKIATRSPCSSVLESFFGSRHSDSLTVCCHKIFIAFEYPRKIRLMMLSWNLKRPKFSSHFVEEQGQKLHLLFDTYIKTFTRVSLVCEIVFNFIQFPSSPFSLEKIT